MLWILLIVVLGVVAYRYRVKILARVLGQPERRIERQIGRKKNNCARLWTAYDGASAPPRRVLWCPRPPPPLPPSGLPSARS